VTIKVQTMAALEGITTRLTDISVRILLQMKPALRIRQEGIVMDYLVQSSSSAALATLHLYAKQLKILMFME
jgi:hypothetical protein